MVRLVGEIGIACAQELQDELLKGIGSGKELQLNVEALLDLDVTTIQILWATARQAEKTGTSFVIDGRLPEKVRGAVRDAGFEIFPVPLSAPNPSAGDQGVPADAEDQHG